MQRSDFSFQLPTHLIAQHPTAQRTASRLLYLATSTGQVVDLQFTDFSRLLKPYDLLVFNDTQVIPARILGHKASGGKLEVLVERLVTSHQILAQIRASKAPKLDEIVYFPQNFTAQVIGREEHFFRLQFLERQPVTQILQMIGHIPLPPYIKRADNAEDMQRYQTVFARQPGAVAAPTAGLHFDENLLAQLSQQGIQQAFITLHVGAGTFSPVRVEDLNQHQMHSEWLEVSATVCEQIAQTRRAGGRVIAVGTTSIRALETASQQGNIQPYQGETQLFITPGYTFRSVDALLTNFHLPESTLLMLVCAFGGYEQVLAAYRHAVAKEYRFFSYGDAMFLDK